jgi:hypothetical protein
MELRKGTSVAAGKMSYNDQCDRQSTRSRAGHRAHMSVFASRRVLSCAVVVKLLLVR